MLFNLDEFQLFNYYSNMHIYMHSIQTNRYSND